MSVLVYKCFTTPIPNWCYNKRVKFFNILYMFINYFIVLIKSWFQIRLKEDDEFDAEDR